MSRLFVCPWPPENVIELLGELDRMDEVRTRFVFPENSNVTLRFLSDADPNDVATADWGSFAPADIEMGSALGGGRNDQHIRFLPIAGAHDLVTEVVGVSAT